MEAGSEVTLESQDLHFTIVHMVFYIALERSQAAGFSMGKLFFKIIGPKPLLCTIATQTPR